MAIPVEYRFAPGESDDGARLHVALLALPGLTRAAVDAAVPGLAEPRIEALLRSLPKDARRNLIPIGDTAAQFLAAAGAGAADPQGLKAWLKERRGIPDALLRFDLGCRARPPDAATGGDGRRQGSCVRQELGELRRASAAAARAELDAAPVRRTD